MNQRACCRSTSPPTSRYYGCTKRDHLLRRQGRSPRIYIHANVSPHLPVSATQLPAVHDDRQRRSAQHRREAPLRTRRGERPAGRSSAAAAQVLPQPVAMGTAGGGTAVPAPPLPRVGVRGGCSRVCVCVSRRYCAVTIGTGGGRRWGRGRTLSLSPSPCPQCQPGPRIQSRGGGGAAQPWAGERGARSCLAPAPPCLTGRPAVPAALRIHKGEEEKII